MACSSTMVHKGRRRLSFYITILIGAGSLIIFFLFACSLSFKEETSLFLTFNYSSTTHRNEIAINELSPEQSSIEGILTIQRHLIAEELEGYKYPKGRNGANAISLQDLVPELGGQPARTLIVTTWRSGSTFLGEVVNNHPANYYHYEPLLDYNIVQIRGGSLASRAVERLYALFNCNYTGDQLNRYLRLSKRYPWIFGSNPRLFSQCDKNHLCQNRTFLTAFCRLFPFQSMKVVRIRLKALEELFDDSSLNIKAVLLVRDPRGTMRSRKKHSWCRSSADCGRAAALCSDMVSDYYAALYFRDKYPNRLSVLRYEDLSLNPYSEVKKLFQFLDLEFHSNVQRFLDSHTNADGEGLYTTFHNSSATVFHWRQDLSHMEVQNIQHVCKEAMELWAYRFAANGTHQLNFNPVKTFTF